MPLQNAQNERPGNILYALILFLMIGAVVKFSFETPMPVGLDAPETEYSAARATNVLSYLLGDESPHPVGSLANHAVRDRLLAHLQQMGLTPFVQRDIGCAAQRNICANVENVIAQIPGSGDDIVVLMAHYDSVPNAPGAGDDGAGVAAILEVARIVQLQPKRKNSVLLVFTDAEEVGLLGAEAFFNQHPLASRVKAVINLEGAGSGGPSMLLRTTTNGATLFETFRRDAQAPMAFSIVQEIFSRMPNDTDFSVSERADIPSIDFAFSFDFNHYHTPNDTIANLDKGTLQHHGMNALPIVMGLLNADLLLQSSPSSYFSIHKSFWLTWPIDLSLPLATLALCLLAFVSFRVWAQTQVGPLLLGFITAIAALVLGAAFSLGLLYVGDLIAGTTPKFPAQPWPWRILLFGGPLLAVSLSGWLLGKRLSFWPLFLGGWWLLAIMAFALAWVAPLAANTVLIPVLSVSVIASAIVLLKRPGNFSLSVLALSGLAAISYSMLILAYSNEQTQGLGLLAPSIFGCVMIACVAFLPFRLNARFASSVAIALGIGLIWLTIAPLYSSLNPQHISISHVQNADKEVAYWVAQSANPLPNNLQEALGEESAHGKMYPWSTQQNTTYEAPYAQFQKGEYNAERHANTIQLNYTADEEVQFVSLVIPDGQRVQSVIMAGHSMQPKPYLGVVQLYFIAPAATGSLSLQLEVTGDEAVNAYLLEGKPKLPPAAQKVAQQRGELAVPVHQGDRFISFRKLRF